MQLKQLLLIWTLIMDKFDVFWDEMGAYFNENTPAVDDRWRQEILYMPIAIDLCEIIIHRQLPYDKYKVPIEEGVTTSTGVRNKKSLVGTNSTLAASDHDSAKLLLTPSVIFLLMFQQLLRILFIIVFNAIQTHHISAIPSILCLYTDGGPDHRTTFGSVQISLFLRGDFDMLIALRTAPYHSWKRTGPDKINTSNSVIMSGVAIMRDIMSTELEDIFKKVDALEEIHAAAAKNEDLKNGLRDCILNIQQLLHSRTERLMHVKQRQKYYQRKRISRTHYRICHYSFQIKNVIILFTRSYSVKMI
ncbi:hypothetical protein GLOIN_2v1778764 [Rhizophagus irregularis DAOM 181602=DAOM 197198]|nr:hypothetical protein GLOIN_2v1778764 [Rhizophagus irregularis DAOM 181602=DAOM 197198]